MIFDPYYSSKERGTQKGMGLGLATSYSIIKKHHGKITAASEVGVGTTINIYLPA
ncbi:ATP-binding protein, partial [Candidatus Desulfatibia sp.]|uniref:ATP-binding protein n=1 Tax=Candidatus Desulfatibia sp. TaxID=3101189 RepID=UPI0039B8A1EF